MKFTYLFLLLITLAPAKAQTFIGPVDNAGHLDKKYDSTVTYYWQPIHRSRIIVPYMNLHRNDTTHSFYRDNMSFIYLEKRLKLYAASNLELKKYHRSRTIILVSLGCLFSGIFTAAVSNSDKNIDLVAAGLDLSGIFGIILFGKLAPEHYEKAIANYNKSVENGEPYRKKNK